MIITFDPLMRAALGTGVTSLAALVAGLGATTDAAVTAGATGSISAKLRSVSRDIGGTTDAAVTAGETGTVSAKLRAISRDIGSLVSGGISVTALDLAGIAESTVPAIGTDGVSSKLWVNLFGQLPIAGYDLSANGTRVFQDAAPLRRSSEVYTLLDAVSTTQTSVAVDLTGYNSVLIWIESAESDGGVNATLQVNRAIEAGDTGASFGTALTLDAAGQRSTDLTGIMPGLVSVTLTRTTGTFTVKMKAQA